ncbi:MAG: PCMD domain-containing protein [Muribaculaceae bacterium]|nr:PCMD domain-containing protein [Muribaculaceae bacterium]
MIKDAKASTKYRFRINYEDPDTEMGAGAFDISIDEESLDIRHDIHFRTSPEIKGYSDEAHEDFELGENAPFSRATNNVGNLQISVRSSGTLNAVTMNMNELSALTGTSTNTIDFMTSDDKNIDILKSKGIIGSFTSNKEKEISTCLITLSDSFTNTLKEGEYKITISATDIDFGTEDVNPKTTATMLRLIVSDDGAILLPATDPDIEAQTPTSLVFRGKVSKNDVDEVGFYYRAEGETGWKYIEGNVASRSILINKEFEATVTNLKQGCTYEYKAAFNRKEGLASMQQTTLNPQLPNAGFEIAQGSKPTVFYTGDKSNMFWDSGNHGSCSVAFVARDVTTLSSEIKNSGDYSVKLYSQSIFGVLAAGNIFIGEYLRTDGTNGVLGWGRKFEGLKYCPKQLKGYVKYNPGTVSSTNNNVPDIVKGQPDKGIIYIALLNDDCNVQGNGTNPVEVRTKDAHLFDKTASNVIAYGEKVFDKTGGDGMIEFTIDLDYYRKGEIPEYIIITASASKGGDYFAGADGSIMYLDDLELVY